MTRPSSLSLEGLALDDQATAAEVAGFLQGCPTSFAQQTLQWGAVITAIDRDEPAWLACRRSGRLVGLLPAYRYAGPLGSILTSVPQAGALGGVAIEADEDREEVSGVLIDGFIEMAASLDCDLATLISNPFWPDQSWVETRMSPDFLLTNVLHALNLSHDVDTDGEPLNATPTLRRNIRRARAGDLRIDEEQTSANVEEWIAIHEQRACEIGAPALPAALFRAALESMVPADLARFFFVRVGDSGEMAAGGLYLHHGKTMDAFMPSINSRHADLRPNHFLAAHTIGYAKRRGFEFYNWQGSPPDSGVLRFKQQWGGREYGYCIATKVTGSADAFLGATVQELVEGYPWHYVLPFDRLDGKERGGTSSREAAWAARAVTDG